MKRSSGMKKLETGEDDALPIAALAVTSPLETSVVLNHLFKLCPASLLASCRLVSKQWYKESLLTWRSDFPITLCPMEEDEDSSTEEDNESWAVRNHKSDSMTGFDEFLNYCQDPENKCRAKPYSFIEIENCRLYYNLVHFQQFRTVIGNSLKRLSLQSCIFKNAEEFRKIIFASFPTLTTLQLMYCTFIGGTTEELEEYREPPYGKHKQLKSLKVRFIRPIPSLPVSWMEVFSHFQSLAYFSVRLQVASLKMNHNEMNEKIKNLLGAVQNVRRYDLKALAFKTFDIGEVLDISNPDSQHIMEMVANLRLPIKTLEISGHAAMEEENVKRNLEQQAKTVMKLEATRAPPIGWTQPFPFGIHLDKLSILQIGEEVCKNMNFLKFTPNLKRLFLTPKEYSDSEDDGTVKTNVISRSCRDEMDHVRLVHLVEFAVGKNIQYMTDQDLTCLFDWMPNLTSLTMTLDDHQFGLVCGYWKCLVTLNVRGDQLTDVGVTGMQTASEVDVGRHPPNITHLQDLEAFRFESMWITDTSVFGGFLKLPHLRRVEYLFYYRPSGQKLQWGEKAMEAMKKQNIAVGHRSN